MTEEELFHAALAKQPDERQAFLNEACGANTELRAAVEALLVAHEEPGSFLCTEKDQSEKSGNPETGNFENPVDATIDSEGTFGRDGKSNEGKSQLGNEQEDSFPQMATTYFCPDAQPDLVIGGRYKLQEKIGEGGMGEVWVAKQTEPVKRRVAIKLVKAGMDSRQVLSRFEQERQALAMMDHPNIARVLDGGMTPSGHPFFVMELVNGLQLTRYCDEVRLTFKERLELFVLICQAVQHAHHKGIVHRDLKPANILVTNIDGRPVPKIIDFGVSKAIGESPTDSSIATQFGTVVGTLEYMSPEQAGYSGNDIDTRADIYSLGVILYELLTGLRPIDSQRLKEAALTEMIRIIREEEPWKPSTRLSSDASLPSMAALRRTDPRRLTEALRGELDWVVMKCLEKQRDRRYETANALARDIQCFLADEPVEARPPSARYRMNKFLKRHRGPVLAATVVLIALVAGIIGTSFGMVEAMRQKRLADDRKQEAIEAREDEARRAESEAAAKQEAIDRKNEADIQRKLAEERLVQIETEQKKTEQEKRIAQAVRDFLQDKLLRQADVYKQADLLQQIGGSVGAAKENPTIRELLDRATVELSAEKIESSFPEQPLVQAEILGTVGKAYVAVGGFDPGLKLLERALALCQTHLGKEHPDTVKYMIMLGTARVEAGILKPGEQILEEGLELAKATFGPDDLTTADCMNSLSAAYQLLGKLEKGLELAIEVHQRKTRSIAPDDPESVRALANLAAAYNHAGKPQQALETMKRAVSLSKEICGPDHPLTFFCMSNLATCYGALGNRDPQQALMEEAVNGLKNKLGEEHPFTLHSIASLAEAYRQSGDLPRGLNTLQEVAGVMEKKLGKKHPITLRTMSALADMYMESGKLDRCLELYEETLALQIETLGPDHPETLATQGNKASGHSRIGELDKCLELWGDKLRRLEALYGPDHPQTLFTAKCLGATYVDLGKIDEGRPLIEKAYSQGEKYPELLDSALNLTKLLASEGKLSEGVKLLEETVEKYKRLRGPDHPETMKCHGWLGTGYFRSRQLDKSLPLFEKLLPQQARVMGRSHPDTIETMTNLAVNYGQAGRLDDALSLFKEALGHQEAMGVSHQLKTLRMMKSRMVQLLQFRDLDEALKFAEAIFEACRPEVIQELPDYVSLVQTTGGLHEQAGHREKALEVYEKALKNYETAFGSIKAEDFVLTDLLGVSCWRQRQFEKAINVYSKALVQKENLLGRKNISTLRTVLNLGVNYKDAGQFDLAIPLLEEAHRASAEEPELRWGIPHLIHAYAQSGDRKRTVELLNVYFGQIDESSNSITSRQAGEMAMIGMALLKAGFYEDSEPILRASLKFREKNSPDAWTTFNSMSMLGGALLGQGKTKEAETLLTAGHEGLIAREKTIPPLGKDRVKESLERLVKLYTKLDKPDEAKKWQNELDRRTPKPDPKESSQSPVPPNKSTLKDSSTDKSSEAKD